MTVTALPPETLHASPPNLYPCRSVNQQDWMRMLYASVCVWAVCICVFVVEMRFRGYCFSMNKGGEMKHGGGTLCTKVYIFLMPALLMLHTPVCYFYSRSLHSVSYTLMVSAHCIFHTSGSTILCTHLTPAHFTLHTPDPCAHCIIQSWPLHIVCETLLMGVVQITVAAILCAMLIPSHWAFISKHTIVVSGIRFLTT